METLQMFYMDNGITPRLKEFFPKDDLYFRCSMLFNSGDTCVDRFNLLHKYSKYNWGNFEYTITPKHIDKSYIDICIDYAKQLMKRTDKIAVMWSGGVDSTGLIAILLEAGMNPKNIDVIGTVSSLREAPNFDKYFKKLGVNYKEIPKDVYMYTAISQYTDAPIILTGICNDQLWYRGRNIVNLNVQGNLSIIQNDWKDQLLYEYKTYNLDDYVMNDIDVFEQYLKTLNMECESFAEFSQMINYCLHWEYVKCFYTLQTNDKVNSKLLNFYDTQDFQDWGYTNRKYTAETAVLCNRGKTEFYKKPLKDLIYKYMPDEEYYRFKVKQASVKTYKAAVDLPFYTVSVKTSNVTKIHHISAGVTEKQYISYALKVLEEFKK